MPLNNAQRNKPVRQSERYPLVKMHGFSLHCIVHYGDYYLSELCFCL